MSNKDKNKKTLKLKKGGYDWKKHSSRKSRLARKSRVARKSIDMKNNKKNIIILEE